MIRFRSIAVTLCVLLGNLSARVVADSPASLQRLAIVDDSASMQGERAATVRDELLKVARQLPPSPTHPFGLITFGSTAAAVQWFTDLPAFERAVHRLTGNSGGTNIASGLQEAAAALRSRLKSGNLCILLYTDGEDGNEAGILQAESELDALFAQRQQVGLSQSVFVKRWGNANSALVRQLQQHGRATIVDAGELAMQPLTFAPTVRVLASTWEQVESKRLRVTYSPQVTVRGHQGLLAPVAMLCLNRGASGHVESLVVPNSPQPLTRTMVVPVTDAQIKAGQLSLQFEVRPPANQHTKSGIVLPTLATNRVMVTVQLPTRIMRRTLTATLAAGAEASWHDPLQRIAAFPVKLTVRFMNEQGDSAQPAARFQIVQDAHCQLIAGASEFELIANQPQTLPLTLATRAASTDKSEYRVGVTVVPLGASPRVEYVPPRVHTELTGLKSPAVMTTTIATTVTGQSAPHWIDLVTCTARFAADVEFDVRGPINHGARITLVAPPDVTGFEFTPEVLQTGRQTVRFTIDVRLAPRPQQTTLTFQIAPPPPQGGVRFAKPLPWRLQVEGPSPVNLAAVIGGRFPTQLTTAIADNEATASLDFTPIVNGTAAVAQGLTAEVVASGAGIATFGSPDSPLFTDMAAQIQVRPPASRPFFRDVLVQGHLQLRTRPPTAAVQPVQYPLVIAVRAPFKRLAFLLSVSLSGLLTVILLTRLYVKLRSTDVSS